MRRIPVILFVMAFAAPMVWAQQSPSQADTGPDNPSELYELQHS